MIPKSFRIEFLARRREFISLLGGAAAWPLAATAQQPDRLARVGVMMALDETDPEGKAQLSGFMRGLADLGWTDGNNLRMDAVRNDREDRRNVGIIRSPVRASILPDSH